MTQTFDVGIYRRPKPPLPPAPRRRVRDLRRWHIAKALASSTVRVSRVHGRIDEGPPAVGRCLVIGL